MHLTSKDLIKLNDLDEGLVKLVLRVAANFPIGIAQTKRTLEESKANKAAGKSWLKNPASSKHILRPGESRVRAVDFFLRSADGSANWKVEDYAPVVAEFKAVAKELGIKIICGYDWKQRDAGHVELS